MPKDQDRLGESRRERWQVVDPSNVVVLAIAASIILTLLAIMSL